MAFRRREGGPGRGARCTEAAPELAKLKCSPPRLEVGTWVLSGCLLSGLEPRGRGMGPPKQNLWLPAWSAPGWLSGQRSDPTEGLERGRLLRTS